MSKKKQNIFENLPDWYAYLAFVLTTLVFFNQHIFGDMFFWEDFIEYVYPAQSFAARESQGFSLPFWNPYIFNGMPFIADLQVGFFYPMNRLLNLFLRPDGSLPVAALQFVIIIHFLISQLGFFSLARNWNISKPGAIIGAISYSFSMIMVCHVIHPMMIYHLALLPWILRFFASGIREQKKKHSIIAGLILAIALLSGHPQTTLYMGSFLFLYFIWTFISRIRNKNIEVHILKTLFSGLVPFFIAVGIFAIQYLPSQELADLSQRSEFTYERATEGSMLLKQTFSAVVPGVFGKITGLGSNSNTFWIQYPEGYRSHYYWETSFYFGIGALILGLFAFITRFKENRIQFLMLSSIIALLFAYGSNGFLYDIFYNLPLFGQFRNPARILFILIMSFSLAAGFGFDRLLQLRKKDTIALIIPLALVTLIGILAKTGFFFNSENLPQNIIDLLEEDVTTSFTMILVFVVFIAGTFFFKIRSLAAPLILFVFLDLYLAGAEFNQSPKNPEKEYQLPGQLKEAFSANTPNEFFRVRSRLYQPISYMSMKRNQGMVDKIMLMEGYNPLILERPNVPLNTEEKLYDIMSVKFQIGLDKRNNQPRFYERFNRYPHAWTIRDYEVVKSEETKDIISTTEKDLRSFAYLESKPNIDIKPDTTLKDNLKMTEYDANSIKYEVDLGENAIVVFSEIHYPAWKVYIDGQANDLIRANHALRAIAVQKGKHTIEMRYESSAFFIGSLISIFVFLGSVLGLVILKD